MIAMEETNVDSPEKRRPTTMRAIVHERYGRPEVLELLDVDVPVIADDRVLVRVHASSVNPVEWYGVTGLFLARIGDGLRRPKTTSVGADLAGRSKPSEAASAIFDRVTKSSARASAPGRSTPPPERIA